VLHYLIAISALRRGERVGVDRRSAARCRPRFQRHLLHAGDRHLDDFFKRRRESDDQTRVPERGLELPETQHQRRFVRSDSRDTGTEVHEEQEQERPTQQAEAGTERIEDRLRVP
jgi:hypothetical protein